MPVKEVARMLGLSPRTVARWLEQGRIPSLVTGEGERRCRPEDVEDVVKRIDRPP